MRKAIAAVAAGLLLVAGQAVAAGSNSAVTRVGDRIGAKAGQSEQLLGVPIAVLIIGGVVIITTIAVVADNGDSD